MSTTKKELGNYNGSPTLGLFYYIGIKLSRNHTRYSNRLGQSGNDID